MNRLEPRAHLEPEQITHLVGRAGVTGVTRAEVLEGGLITTNYRVSTPSRDVVLRVYPAHREPSEVAFELSVLRHLRDQGLPVPGPLPADADPILHSFNDRQYVVLEYLPGRPLGASELSTRVASQAGALYGRMQNALRDFSPTGTKSSADGDAVAELIDRTVTSLAARDPERAALLRTSWDSATAEATDDRTASVGVVHGDFYCENVLVEDSPDGPSLTGLIDFDDSYVGDLGLDLVLAATEFAYDEDDTLHAERLHGFLAAYASATTTPVLLDGATFRRGMSAVFCKFACYTLPLNNGTGEDVRKNPYLNRLAKLMADNSDRDKVDAVLGSLAKTEA